MSQTTWQTLKAKAIGNILDTIAMITITIIMAIVGPKGWTSAILVAGLIGTLTHFILRLTNVNKRWAVVFAMVIAMMAVAKFSPVKLADRVTAPITPPPYSEVPDPGYKIRESKEMVEITIVLQGDKGVEGPSFNTLAAKWPGWRFDFYPETLDVEVQFPGGKRVSWRGEWGIKTGTPTFWGPAGEEITIILTPPSSSPPAVITL